MESSDRNRLSVILVDVAEGREEEFAVLSAQLAALLVRKKYGVAETIRDESHTRRFYAVRRWTDAAAAAACHADPDVQRITAALNQLARVTHVVNGVHPADPLRVMLDERRLGSDRRAGFDRRAADTGRADGDRRSGQDRRQGPRRLHSRSARPDVLDAARRARARAGAALPARVAAAIETAEGEVVTGCTVEHAALGPTICAERVALMKALSEGHREFRRIAIVAETEGAPCDACREILWALAGNVEVLLAPLNGPTRTYRLKDLPPAPAGTPRHDA